MRCLNCKKELQSNFTFCPYCGNPTISFCPYCGKPMADPEPAPDKPPVMHVDQPPTWAEKETGGTDKPPVHTDETFEIRSEEKTEEGFAKSPSADKRQKTAALVKRSNRLLWAAVLFAGFQLPVVITHILSFFPLNGLMRFFDPSLLVFPDCGIPDRLISSSFLAAAVIAAFAVVSVNRHCGTLSGGSPKNNAIIKRMRIFLTAAGTVAAVSNAALSVYVLSMHRYLQWQYEEYGYRKVSSGYKLFFAIYLVAISAALLLYILCLLNRRKLPLSKDAGIININAVLLFVIQTATIESLWIPYGLIHRSGAGEYFIVILYLTFGCYLLVYSVLRYRAVKKKYAPAGSVPAGNACLTDCDYFGNTSFIAIGRSLKKLNEE